MTANWQTISSLATAGGTLVLALATFSAVRSSNRSARIAEEGFLSALRPLLVHSLPDDPPLKVLWSDRHSVHLGGGRATFEEEGGVIYLAMGLRNAGSGIALLHGWHAVPDRVGPEAPHADVDDFQTQTLDMYIPAGDAGFWEGAVRADDDPRRPELLRAMAERTLITIELLYGDQQGRQRTISRFNVLPSNEEGWFCRATKHWNLDGRDPR